MAALTGMITAGWLKLRAQQEPKRNSARPSCSPPFPRSRVRVLRPGSVEDEAQFYVHLRIALFHSAAAFETTGTQVAPTLSLHDWFAAGHGSGARTALRARSRFCDSPAKRMASSPTGAMIIKILPRASPLLIPPKVTTAWLGSYGEVQVKLQFALAMASTSITSAKASQTLSIAMDHSA